MPQEVAQPAPIASPAHPSLGTWSALLLFAACSVYDTGLLDLNGDCNVLGTGVCAESVAASSRWGEVNNSCSYLADPVRTPCDAGAVLRQCLRAQCRSRCNFGV